MEQMFHNFRKQSRTLTIPGRLWNGARTGNASAAAGWWVFVSLLLLFSPFMATNNWCQQQLRATSPEPRLWQPCWFGSCSGDYSQATGSQRDNRRRWISQLSGRRRKDEGGKSCGQHGLWSGVDAQMVNDTVVQWSHCCCYCCSLDKVCSIESAHCHMWSDSRRPLKICTRICTMPSARYYSNLIDIYFLFYILSFIMLLTNVQILPRGL